MDKKQYDKLAKKISPNTKSYKTIPCAFLIGGFICLLGQGFLDLYQNYFKLDEQTAIKLVPVSLVFLSALLTALKVYDNIAKVGGAGTLVPITGFANAVVSPALEFKTEGYILGVGAKIFTIAGPVIAYGTVASVIYGAIYWLMRTL